MCGRFTLRTTPAELSEFFSVPLPESLPVPRYNIAPTQSISVVVQQDAQTRWDFHRWGLVPSWAKDLSIGNRMINARGETVAEKPSFRSAFKKRRCIVMADGFYEWEKTADGKQPHYFTMQNESPLAFAGLWEVWRKGDEPVTSCTIITTTANELLGKFHDRMPVILNRDDFAQWLDPEFQDTGQIQKLIQPFPAEEMDSRTVSKLVNSVKNETKDCLS